MRRIVIIGSGIAGLFCALRCARAGCSVAIVTKDKPTDSSTNWAQGGIAAILDKTNEKGIELHIQDTLKSGAGLCDEDIVKLVVEEAGDRIQDLLSIGVNFEKNQDGNFDYAMEGGHSQNIILHSKDATGAEIEASLIEAVEQEKHITMYPNTLAVDLILSDKSSLKKEIVGVWCLDLESSEMRTISADATIIATGGGGQLFRQTTNPEVATADGIAMANRAGAKTRDLEFVQFHPTALALDAERPFLITEVLRGQGAVLMSREDYRMWHLDGCNDDPEAKSFIRKYTPKGSLDTRDIIARAIDYEMKVSGESHVLLVTEHLHNSNNLSFRFPNIQNRLSRYGLNLGIDPIPVAPAAHYLVGGLFVDHEGIVMDKKEDAIDRLYAIGETACTGMHGANRLASNSLLEALVYAHRASNNIISKIKKHEFSSNDLPKWRADGLQKLVEHSPLVHDLNSLKATMSDDVGLVRKNSRLKRAMRRLELLSDEIDMIWKRCVPSRELVELRNMVQIGTLICDAALKRRNNVGLHYNLDFAD